MDANRTLGERTASRRREIRDRILLAGAILLVLAGVVVFFQTRADEAVTPVAASNEKQQVQEPVVKAGGKLDPAVRVAAQQFIASALGRVNLAKSWAMASPELRNGITKEQWLRGELPAAPFPVRDLATTGFDVVGTAPGKVLLQVLLVPELNSGFVPTRYDLTLVRHGKTGPWKVSYFLPYAPPGMYTEPE